MLVAAQRGLRDRAAALARGRRRPRGDRLRARQGAVRRAGHQQGAGRRRCGRPARASARRSRSRRRWSPRRRSARRSPASSASRTVNPGQYLNPGDKIVTLQPIDPIYVDFALPQQQLPQVAVGQTRDAHRRRLPGRSLRRQDHRDQPQGRRQHAQRAGRGDARRTRSASCCRACSPASTSTSAAKQRYLTLPQTAITYNPYGATVFVPSSAVATSKDAEGQGRALRRQAGLRDHRRRRAATRSRSSRASRRATRSSPAARSSSRTARRSSIDNTVQPANSPQPDAAGTVRQSAMNFTDIFIRRPVLAIVVSLLILVLGLRSLVSLPVRQYPQDPERRGHGHAPPTTAPTPRPSPASSPSRWKPRSRRRRASTTCPRPARHGVSTITATLRLNYDANRALTEINTQVNSVRNQLPPRGPAAGADRAGRRDRSTRCTWASSARRCRPTTSPTT